QWGACWLACQLWDRLRLAEFWSDKLPASRQGTRWLNVFKTLVCYRLIDPGSEWRLHRYWYEQSAMGDLLGEDVGLVQIDKRLPYKEDLFTSLKQRWQALFDVGFEVLLYDLSSTYFESDPPEDLVGEFHSCAPKSKLRPQGCLKTALQKSSGMVQI